jgi:predicted DCC family thiol-disulfide oxidoreductase YuxK
MDTNARPILFYDGDCGLCARSVQWALRHDHRGVVHFAPLQGTTYAAIDAPGKSTALNTVVLHDARGLHTRSDAVLGLLDALGGIWPSVASAGRIIPRGLRDWAYAFIAKRRIAWFGTADACALPKADQAGRFLP